MATIPIGILGGALLARAWWLQVRHGISGKWAWRSFLVLATSTALAATLWGLRFGGIVGA